MLQKFVSQTKREWQKFVFWVLTLIFSWNDNAFLQTEEVLLCSRDWSCLVWKELRQPFPSSYWSTPHNDSIDSCKLIKSLLNPKHKQDFQFSLSIPSHFLKSQSRKFFSVICMLISLRSCHFSIQKWER